MSSTSGNIMPLQALLTKVPAEALRLFLLDAPTSGPLPVSEERLWECVAALDRLYHAREILDLMTAEEPLTKAKALLREFGEFARDLHRHGVGFPEAFGQAMDDNVDTATATGHLFALVRAVNRFGNNRAWIRRSSSLSKPGLLAMKIVAQVLGIGALKPAEWFHQVRSLRLASMGQTEAHIDARIQARLAARAGRDWAKADTIRDELDALGVVVMDDADATSWRVRVG